MALNRQRKYQMALGTVPQVISIVDDYGRKIGETNNLVFTQISGNVWNEPRIVRLIHRIVKKQNDIVSKTNKPILKYFTPHQVQHTYATLAYEAGADEKEVSLRLGNASEQVTRDTYTHLCGKKKEEPKKVINKVCIS